MAHVQRPGQAVLEARLLVHMWDRLGTGLGIRHSERARREEEDDGSYLAGRTICPGLLEMGHVLTDATALATATDVVLRPLRLPAHHRQERKRIRPMEVDVEDLVASRHSAGPHVQRLLLLPAQMPPEPDVTSHERSALRKPMHYHRCV
jgi:hypothetical protein